MSEEAEGDRGAGSRGPRTALARLLAQRVELGDPDLIFPELGRLEVLDLARRAGQEGVGRQHGTDPGGPERASGRGGATSAPPPPAPTTAPAEGPPSADAAPAPPSGTPHDLPRDHEDLRTVASACARCRLAEGRTQVVFHDGNPGGRLMVVGEAPGANEDRTGLPFVGQAGRLLDLLLASVALSRRQSVYICNVIKCRPPGNRDPRPDEIEECAPYLRRQIEVVEPEAILAVGTFSGKLLSGKDLPLGRLRGEVYAYQGVPLVVTYHPAALLRNAGWTRATWEDLQLLRQVLDTPGGE